MISLSISEEHAKTGEMVAALSGSISESEARQAKALLTTFIETHAVNFKLIKVDVSALENVSSIAVAFLLSGLRAANKYACTVSYINLPEYLFNIARVGGVETILSGVD